MQLLIFLSPNDFHWAQAAPAWYMAIKRVSFEAERFFCFVIARFCFRSALLLYKHVLLLKHVSFQELASRLKARLYSETRSYFGSAFILWKQVSLIYATV
jgi:hypothetical protein